MKNPKFWISGFLVLLVVNVLANQFESLAVSGLTKIFLMPFLAMLIFVSTEKKTSRVFRFTILALLFSWFGDILLIYQESGSQFFLLGLGAFLLAQLFYIFSFHNAKEATGIRISGWKWVITILILLTYLFVFFSTIGPGLGTFRIPVVAYATVISGMFLSAFSRNGKTTSQSFFLVFTGATIFIISDSLIALDKFWQPVIAARTMIMLTYGVAQFLIILGLIYHIRKIERAAG